MSDVIDLYAPEPKIWVCDCGCSSFELFSDNTARCALCGVETSEGGWHQPDEDNVWQGDEPVREISGNGVVDFAKRLIAKRMAEPDVVLAVIVKEHGAISTWSNIETEEQRKWADRQLKKVKNILATGKS